MQYLFTRNRLADVLSAAGGAAMDKLAAWPPDDLLNTPEADVIEQLVGLAALEVPSLERDKKWLDNPAEIKVDVEDFGRQFQATLTRHTLVVPVIGDPSVFGLRASVFSTGSIPAEIDKKAGTLRLHCDNPDNGDQARAYFERALDDVEQRLQRTRADIETHNAQLARQLQLAVAQRRAKLLNDRNLQASIGYPIKRRPDADSYSIPLTRRQIRPDRPARQSGRSNAYAPEPAMDDADYEAVLEVLRYGRNALERSPSMSAKLDEQEARDLLLFFLNANFEGKAAGEVFNGTGKTDILVREGDRNVFIGECKILDPRYKQSVEHVVTGALGQLLNDYLTWRDTKAALLLFIRDANVSAVVTNALTTISGHPNHKRPGKISTEERHDFVLHANGDTNREIHLAFLPFLIASKSA